MAYLVQGTSAGGTTTVERDTAEAAYGTAREMQHARYADISVSDPAGVRTPVIGRADQIAKSASQSPLPGRI